MKLYMSRYSWKGKAMLQKGRGLENVSVVQLFHFSGEKRVAGFLVVVRLGGVCFHGYKANRRFI